MEDGFEYRENDSFEAHEEYAFLRNDGTTFRSTVYYNRSYWYTTRSLRYKCTCLRCKIVTNDKDVEALRWITAMMISLNCPTRSELIEWYSKNYPDSHQLKILKDNLLPELQKVNWKLDYECVRNLKAHYKFHNKLDAFETFNLS